MQRWSFGNVELPQQMMRTDPQHAQSHTRHAISLVAGLGNPGEEYAHTPHNIGFEAVDALAELFSVSYWKQQSGCLVASVSLTSSHGTKTIYLAKPQGFMNTSGGPLSRLLRALSIDVSEMLVIHDEVDLEPELIQLKWGGGLNAHNGLKSIAQKFGTQDFGRIRCGIGRPPGKMRVSDYVLRKVKGDLALSYDDTCARAAEAAQRALTEGFRA